RKVAGAARGANVLQAEPADVDGEPGSDELGEARLVTRVELGPPIDVDITRLAGTCGFCASRYEQQLLVGEALDDEPGPALRRVEDGNVHASLDEPLHQLFLEADLGPNRDVRCAVAEVAETRQQQAFPDADAAAERQRRAKALRDARVLPSALDRAQKRGRMLLEEPARGRQSRARFVALEKAAAELLLEG